MPKRRRGDESSSPIAQTNATLHQFLGSRQTPWMQPGATEDGTAVGERASAPSVNGRGAQAQQNSTSHNVNAAMSRQTTLAGTFNPPANNRRPSANIQTSKGTSAEPIDLVDYESPYNLPTPEPLTADAQARVTSTGFSTQPLPLPVLTDGSTPPVAVAHSGSASVPRARGRPPSIRTGVGVASTFTASPTMPPPHHGVLMDIPAPAGVGPWTVMTANDLQSRQSPRSLTPISTVGRGSPFTVRSNVPAPWYPGVQSARASAQPQSVRTKNPFDKESMLRSYHTYFEQPDLVLNETDVGRKIMLIDAIQRDDYFYITLSQMFCLQTVQPGHLPQMLSALPEEVWKTLNRLLRGNNYCSQHVVHWFATFPAPLQTIYESDVGMAFNRQVTYVHEFLTLLPLQLQSLVDASRERLAPPLTQDMKEALRLPSPVLQTTLFRMIARVFWGSNDNKGLQTLEHIHRIDQDTYFFHQYRRTASEKTTAYQALASVFQDFQRLISAGYNETTFNAPKQIAYFQQWPASTPRMQQAPTAAPQNYVLQQQQQYAQMEQQYLQQRQQQQQYVQQVYNTRPSVSISIARQPSIPHYGHPQTPVTQPQHLQRLLPGEKDHPRSQPVHPDTTRAALHQAPLRSPIPGPKQLPKEAEPLFRHVIGYALSPTELIPKLYAQTILFTLTQEAIDKVPKVVPPELVGSRGTRLLAEGSNLYRLRCSEMPKEGFQTENTWITADNIWPSNISCEVNGQYIDPRRKLHHGRYLPADLSSLLHAGTNALTVYAVSPITAPLAMAIEIVGVSSQASIMSSLRVQSSSDSENAITQSLAGAADDDDDIVMTSSTLTINLFDPFTADRIFKIPVRGSACLHRDCFDLETFLSQCKREQLGYPCVTDCWRCPICKGDVRPQTLVKDGFLVEVREHLERQGLLHTRAIVVEADGAWDPKAEEQTTGVKSPSLEREEAETARLTTKKVVEIIELD